MSNQPTETLAAWETSSQYWNKHQALIEEMYAPLSLALVEDARVKSGDSVLDVGGGSGEPTLTVARVVGPLGSVTYTDPAAGMVDAARSAAQSKSLGNIQFHQCPGETLPFPDNSFDAAVSRLSSMFFSEPLTAVTEILRVLKPGKRVAFLVWAPREVNPFFSIVTEILDRYVPSEPDPEDAPAAFRFARPGKLAQILREVGGEDVSDRLMHFSIDADVDVEQFWELRTEMSDSFRKKLATLSPDKIAAIKAEVIAGVKPYFTSGTMSFPGQVRIVSGNAAQTGKG
jgi:SAM-dependent methyltransferase